MSREADSAAQPKPTGNGKAVTVEVMADLAIRRHHGVGKYGTELKTGNGRDALADAYQESLDLAMYLKQVIMEREELANTPAPVQNMPLIGSGLTYSEREAILYALDQLHLASTAGGSYIHPEPFTTVGPLRKESVVEAFSKIYSYHRS